MTDIKINTPYIELDALLKFSGYCSTGGEAKMLVQQGNVYVNDIVCTKRGKKIYPQDLVRVDDVTFKIIKEEAPR